MGVLEVLWKPKVIKNAALESIHYSNQQMHFYINGNFADDFTKDSKINFILTERETQAKVTLKVKGISNNNEPTQFVANMDLTKYADTLSEGDSWDAYIIIKNDEIKRKYRLKSVGTAFESLEFFSAKTSKVIKPYVTIKGNFSFKVEPITTVAKVEDLTLTSTGWLTLKGFAFYPSWDDRNASEIKKTIVIRNENGEFEQRFDAKSILYVNKEKLLHTGKIQDYCGFEATINLHDINFEILDENKVEVSIELLQNGLDEQQTESAHLQVTDDTVLKSETCILEKDDFNKTVGVDIDKIHKHISLSILETKQQVEVKTIYAEDSKIIINGEVFSSNNSNLLNGEYIVKIKKRHVEVFFEKTVNLIDSRFQIELDIETLITSQLLREGVWDLYLIIDEKQYRLSSRADGIKNKQKIIQYPQQLVVTKDDNSVVVKPYYTISNDVSLLIRNYIYSKVIDRMIIDADKMVIEGKINIMVPNDEVPEEAKGTIKVKGEYGTKHVLPTQWVLTRTKRTGVEFAFTATTTFEDKEMKKWLTKNIKFDSFECMITLGNHRSSFTININPEKIEKSLEDKLNRKPKLTKLFNKAKITFYRLANKVVPINKDTFIFQSYYGNSYACNPRAIYEELIQQEQNIQAVWILKDTEKELPGNPILVKPNSFKYYFYMAKAKYFINNGNFPDFYQKRNEAVHVQTWHGTPLKRLGLDVDPSSPAYAENTSPKLLNRIKRWDYLIAPNHYTAEILSRAYDFNKEVLETGYPRNDIFYQSNVDEKIEEMKQKLNISKDKKVILYAPTWRDTDKKNQPFEFRFDIEHFREKFGDEYVLLLRLHYFDAARIQLSGYDDFVYNVTYYDDIKDLYLLADILITDYSSVMFDYANLNRPMIFFTYDLYQYGSKLRGFYFDFKNEAPGPLVTNEMQLFEAIENSNEVHEQYKEKFDSFRERFCNLEDGRASKRAIDAFLQN